MVAINSTFASTATTVMAAISHTMAAQNATSTMSNSSATSNASAAYATMSSSQSAINLGVSQCSSRMNKVLPLFIPTGFNYSGTSRQYFVKAEEVKWNYIPSGWDNMRGIPLTDTPVEDGADYVASNTSIGSEYVKALFKGYTDDTFTNRSIQPDWLGFQGPLMRAEVGDMVEIMVYNDLSNPKHEISMHSMGLHYSPNSEGSPYYRGAYTNGTPITYTGAAIPHQECFVYKWLVTNSSAPDASMPSKLWSYHGDLNLQNDIHSGELGPFIAYRSGEMAAVMKKHKEFVMFFATTDEFNSYYLNENVALYTPNATFSATPGSPSPTPSSQVNATIWNPILDDIPATGADETLAQAFTAINGFAYNSMPVLQICQDDVVIWHMWSMGSFTDGFHAAHWHGNNVVDPTGSNQAIVTMLPGEMKTVSMTAANPGEWQLLCHVAAHWQFGMQINYNIALNGTGMC